MTRSFKIEDAAATHVGNVRSENEDSHISIPHAGVWVIADGMGGHSHGRFASRSIVEALGESEFAGSLEEVIDVVAEAVHAANETIYARSLELGTQMGSTFVSLVLREGEFGVLWAGDSRAYVFRDGHLIPLTRDHTQVEALLERGLLTAEEARDHPMKHVLARAVGVQEDLQIDAIRDVVESRDIFLLCSDGLYGVLGEAEIIAILREKGHDACDDLINACLDRGAPDNVTVTLVEAREPTLLSLSGAAS